MDFFYTLLNILLFIVMLGVLVTIHELGHFMVAKMFKVYVFEFSIGFGPKIFPWKGMKVKAGKKPQETKFSIRALPLGGFVSMYGEEGAVPEGFEGVEIDPKRSLKGINRGKRALIMAAGIIMNLVLGYAIFLFSNGALKQVQRTSIVDVAETSPLIALGVNNEETWRIEFVNSKLGGDKIQYFGIGKLNDEAQEYYVLFIPESNDDLSFGGDSIKLVATNAAKLTMDYVYSDFKEDDVLKFEAEFYTQKEDETKDKIVKYEATIPTVLVNESKPADGYKLSKLDFSLTTYTYRNTFKQTFQKANADFVSSATAVVKGLGSLFTDGLDNVGGPIAIFTATSSTLRNQGLANFLFMWGLISVNLAIFNLLPFPPLDGWHLLVVAIEAITRRELNPKFKNIASMVGAILMILFSLVIIGKDIFALFGVVF